MAEDPVRDGRVHALRGGHGEAVDAVAGGAPEGADLVVEGHTGHNTTPPRRVTRIGVTSWPTRLRSAAPRPTAGRSPAPPSRAGRGPAGAGGAGAAPAACARSRAGAA